MTRYSEPEYYDDVGMSRDYVIERPLPNSVEAERAILGAIILDNALYWQARDYGIHPGVFYIPSHARIWVAMVELAESGSEINPILVGEILRRDGQLDSVGGISFISNLMLGLPHFANIARYAEIILGKYNLRTMYKVCSMIQGQILDEEDEPQKILGDGESAIVEFVGKALRGNSKSRPIDYVHVASDEQEFRDTLERRSQGISDAIPTGIKPLDDMLEGGGLNPQGLYLVAAEPKAGKTSMVLRWADTIARRFAKQGVNRSVAAASLEMRRLALEMRMFSAFTGIPFDTLARPGKLRGIEKDNAFAKIRAFFNFPLYITDALFTIPDLWRASERVVYGPMQAGLILVDYLQLLSVHKGRAANPDNLTGEVTIASRELKHMAQTLNVPVVGISSLNELGQLRQSRTLEYDVEALVMLENPQYTKIMRLLRDPKGDVEQAQAMRRELDMQLVWDVNLRLRYQRNGPTGDIPLKFLRKRMQFVTQEEYAREQSGSAQGRNLDDLWEATGPAGPLYR